MSELRKILSANLKVLRQRWGYSQAELAERGGVSVSYVGDLEVGGKWPSAETLERLAEALHVQPYQLLLSPDDEQLYHDWLERRDLVGEIGEKLFAYFEKRRG
jgi:transcriptional regulator with XRE-family HTH domain